MHEPGATLRRRMYLQLLASSRQAGNTDISQVSAFAAMTPPPDVQVLIDGARVAVSQAITGGTF